jgi:hypothetical protein
MLKYETTDFTRGNKMRKWTITIFVLILVLFQVAVTIADKPNTEPSKMPSTTQSTEINQSIDRSKYYDVVICPRSGPPIIFVFKYGDQTPDINIYEYLEGDLLLPPSNWGNCAQASP